MFTTAAIRGALSAHFLRILSQSAYHTTLFTFAASTHLTLWMQQQQVLHIKLALRQVVIVVLEVLLQLFLRKPQFRHFVAIISKNVCVQSCRQLWILLNEFRGGQLLAWYPALRKSAWYTDALPVHQKWHCSRLWRLHRLWQNLSSKHPRATQLAKVVSVCLLCGSCGLMATIE